MSAEDRLVRCIAVMQAINLLPESYNLPVRLLSNLRAAIYNLPVHHPNTDEVKTAQRIVEMTTERETL